MILSRGRKYLFIHIPKTGGTSMALALEDRAMKDDIMLGDTPKAVRRRNKVKDIKTTGRLWKHSKLSDLKGLIDTAELDDMFVFTMVRNPWARMVSYYHWLQMQTFDHPAVTTAKSVDFDAFLATNHIANSIRANHAQSYVSFPNVSLTPCFIRLEHLDTDMKPLIDHLGFDLKLPHTNTSVPVSDYRAHYSPQSASLVADMCSTDIEKFGYSFN